MVVAIHLDEESYNHLLCILKAAIFYFLIVLVDVKQKLHHLDILKALQPLPIAEQRSQKQRAPEQSRQASGDYQSQSELGTRGAAQEAGLSAPGLSPHCQWITFLCSQFMYGPNCGLSSSPQPDLRVVFFFLPYIDHFPGTILPPKPLIVTLRVSLSAHPNTILRKLFYQSTVLILHYQTSLTFDLRVLMYCYLINGQFALIKCSNVVIF